MSIISINQRGAETDSPNAAVSFDGEGEFPITVRNPFSPQEEARLEWYFKQHLRFPFTEQVEAQAAAAICPAHSTQSAMNTFVSPCFAALRFEQKTIFRPSGENIGKPSNVSLNVRHSWPVPSTLIA